MIIRHFRDKGIRVRQVDKYYFLDCLRCGSTIAYTHAQWLEENPPEHCPVAITGIQWSLVARGYWPDPDDTEVSLSDTDVARPTARVYSDTHASPQRVPARRPRPEGE
jgi:hypothetical protein